MQGLEICKNYYLEYGREMLKNFPEAEERAAPSAAHRAAAGQDAADAPLVPIVKPLGAAPEQRVAGAEKEQRVAYRATRSKR